MYGIVVQRLKADLKYGNMQMHLEICVCTCVIGLL